MVLLHCMGTHRRVEGRTLYCKRTACLKFKYLCYLACHNKSLNPAVPIPRTSHLGVLQPALQPLRGDGPHLWPTGCNRQEEDKVPGGGVCLLRAAELVVDELKGKRAHGGLHR